MYRRLRIFYRKNRTVRQFALWLILLCTLSKSHTNFFIKILRKNRTTRILILHFGRRINRKRITRIFYHLSIFQLPISGSDSDTILAVQSTVKEFFGKKKTNKKIERFFRNNDNFRFTLDVGKRKLRLTSLSHITK